MRVPFGLPVCALVVTLVAVAAPTPEPQVTLEPASLRAHLQRAFKRSPTVGLSLGVLQEGKLIFAEGIGKADLKGTPVKPDTAFRIGSITKQFTCAAILKLAEEGRLSVNDKVSKWFPKATRAQDITVLDLMNHVAGYVDFYAGAYAPSWMLKPTTSDAIIAQYATKPLDFEPGSQYSYTNTGYTMLGEIVTQVSGMALGDFLAQRFFQPLGMTRTFYEPDLSKPGFAQGHDGWSLGPLRATPPEGSGWRGAAGGIVSTPADLLKWDLALMDGKALSRDSYALMTKPRTLSNGKVSRYGCGQAMETLEGHSIVRHEGGVAGFHAMNIFLPEKRAGVVLLANTMPFAAQEDTLRPIVRALAGLPPMPEAPAKGSHRSASSKEKCAGPEQAIRTLFTQLQHHKLDRTALAPEFSTYLTASRVAGASKALAKLGALQDVQVGHVSKTPHLELSGGTLTTAQGALNWTLIRSHEGRVEEFHFSRN